MIEAIKWGLGLGLGGSGFCCLRLSFQDLECWEGPTAIDYLVSRDCMGVLANPIPVPL